MMRIDVQGQTALSTLLLGESLAHLDRYCDPQGAVIITDGNVRLLHGHRFPACEVIEIGTGEESKTLKTIEEIYGQFLRLGLDRSSFVLGIGGGIVCDVAGFAASTFLRGLSFGFAPTTLLAQVDASAGGKNGVNLSGYKNLIGTFAQPRFVLCDLDVLRTLPAAEVTNGFAEVIKQAAIGDPLLFSFLESVHREALSLDPDALQRIVHDSLAVKARIVSLDERESGERRKLNFGHTIGHAIERVHHLRHGEAVSIGMTLAAKLSVSMGLLTPSDAGRLENLLIDFGLPVEMRIDRDLVKDALRKDKKRERKEILFVLLDRIGTARVVPLKMRDLERLIDVLC